MYVWDRNRPGIWNVNPTNGSLSPTWQAGRDLPPHTTPSVATRCITGWLVIGGIRASRLYIYTPQMQLASEFDATLWFGPSAKISAALELSPGHILLGVSGVMRSSSENGHGHGAIVEIQRDNPRVIWEPGTGLLAEPTGLDATDRSTVLIADARRHTVTEIDFLGSIRWRFGSPGKPGGGKLLREPRDARVTALGYLITDSLNDRILEVDRAGRIVSVIDRRLNTSNGKYESALSAPQSAVRLPGDATAVSDTGNARIAVFDSINGDHSSRTVQNSKLFSLPRSLQLLDYGNWLVADTNHHRVVTVDPAGTLLAQWGDGRSGADGQLNWPRCARSVPDEGVYVADGANSRIVRYSHEGRFIDELSLRDNEPNSSIERPSDPHHLVHVDERLLLCTDSGSDSLLLVDFAAREVIPYRPFSHKLSDPHMATVTADGNIMVADSGNRRLLITGPTSSVTELAELTCNGSKIPLNYPRYVGPHFGQLVIGDQTGPFGRHGIIYLTDLNGNVSHVLGPSIDSGEGTVTELGPVRDIVSLAPGALVVSDYEHDRILCIGFDTLRTTAP